MNQKSDGDAFGLEHRLRSMILQNDDHVKKENEIPPTIETKPAQSNESVLKTTSPRKTRSGVKQKREYIKLELNDSPATNSSPRPIAKHQYNASVPSDVSKRPNDARSPQFFARTSRPSAIIGQQNSSSPAMRNFHRSVPSRFTPVVRPLPLTEDQIRMQDAYLERIAHMMLADAEMSASELHEKELFRAHLEQSCREALTHAFPHQFPSARLLTFGSIHSGFGMPNCDVDLAFVPSYTAYDMPKALEKCLLSLGHGARLLTRTRVPILRVCERPTPELYAALCQERQKYDDMSPEEQETYLNPQRNEEEQPKADESIENATTPCSQANQKRAEDDESTLPTPTIPNDKANETEKVETGSRHNRGPSTHKRKTWYREKRGGALDFPKDGVGIQCDINFSNLLGLHNSALLRCYSHCDIRVQLLVLFVKKWAKCRKINSSYSGTLSSYGYVLMVLHFLVNVVTPPVCPNLQLAAYTHAANEPATFCEGYSVHFWRNEAEIIQLARQHRLTQNRQSLGSLIREFFHYYAQQGQDVSKSGFGWSWQVLSLRTPGGLLQKQDKGWTGAKTTIQDNREVRNRYLFAIEDPFEIDHNVARTVTHNGIVAIRDEFRRVWRILVAVGRDQAPEGDLFTEVVSQQPDFAVDDKDEVDATAGSAQSATPVAA